MLPVKHKENLPSRLQNGIDAGKPMYRHGKLVKIYRQSPLSSDGKTIRSLTAYEFTVRFTVDQIRLQAKASNRPWKEAQPVVDDIAAKIQPIASISSLEAIVSNRYQ